jgi:GrpB-like predicted nucleotidyltransferase (UPF0157 family)/RimJ/RimL family protein N-acetyltransferase
MHTSLQIVEYDPRWPTAFAIERERLAGVLDALAVRIDHHGSTAVPGLAAKPVIDIQVSVRSLRPLDQMIERLGLLGYVHVPHADDEVCPFFHKPGQWPHTHHVHLVEAGGAEERRTLAFRDYLRARPDLAREYESVKRGLAADFDGATFESREAYAAAKTDFVRRVTDAALAAGHPVPVTVSMLELPIATERLRLREFVAADFDDVHRVESDREVMRYMFRGPRSEQETRTYLSHLLDAQRQSPRSTWELAVVHRDTGRVIGACDLTLNLHQGDGDLGYTLAKDAWGRGYATELAGALMRAGFEQLELARIYSLCAVDHPASARVLEKAGLRFVGIVERCREAKGRWWDMRLYELCASEYPGRLVF